MKNPCYDLIGDIHGQFDKLVDLLAHLGYHPAGPSWKHPEGRKVIFLGDYIDRGPKVREVLQAVRGMVDAGDALAIMGNHEYNAVCYHEPDGKGGWLRAHHWDRDSGLRVSLAQFADRKAEWQDWLRWMRQLPLFLDLGELRAVHACWDAERVAALRGKSLLDEAFLHASVVRSSPEFRAVDRVLKGPELAMPKGHSFHDKHGIARRKVRVRWWDLPEQSRVSHLALPMPFDVPGDAHPEYLRRLPDYGPDEPPVFIGHYWLPVDHARAPLAANIACLDFSAAHDGPLMAYRWDGERVLCASKFVSAPAFPVDPDNPAAAEARQRPAGEGLQPRAQEELGALVPASFADACVEWSRIDKDGLRISMPKKSDTKIAIERLWEEYEHTTDPVRRAEITEAVEDLAGPVGDFGLYDDD